MTKAGRYGFKQNEFDYSPATIRASVERSLERMHTSYLDTVYLHDVEFVCEDVYPRKAGSHVKAVGEEAELYGMKAGEEKKLKGDADKNILNAFAELQKMKEEGLIKKIGICGKPQAVFPCEVFTISFNPRCWNIS